MSHPTDLVERLRLIRTPGIGPAAFRQLLLRFGGATAALAAIPDLVLLELDLAGRLDRHAGNKVGLGGA